MDNEHHSTYIASAQTVEDGIERFTETGCKIVLGVALPDNWQSGSIKGVRARGGFTIDMEWKESRITRLSVTSHSGGTCRIREATSPHEEVIETEKGKTYQVK